jgi:hypothetical protein
MRMPIQRERERREMWMLWQRERDIYRQTDRQKGNENDLRERERDRQTDRRGKWEIFERERDVDNLRAQEQVFLSCYFNRKKMNWWQIYKTFLLRHWLWGTIS